MPRAGRLPRAVVAMGGHYAIKDNREIPDTLEALWDSTSNMMVLSHTTRNSAPASVISRAPKWSCEARGAVYLHSNRWEVVPEKSTEVLFALCPALRSDRVTEKAYSHEKKPGDGRPIAERARRIQRSMRATSSIASRPGQVQLRHRHRAPVAGAPTSRSRPGATCCGIRRPRGLRKCSREPLLELPACRRRISWRSASPVYRLTALAAQSLGDRVLEEFPPRLECRYRVSFRATAPPGRCTVPEHGAWRRLPSTSADCTAPKSFVKVRKQQQLNDLLDVGSCAKAPLSIALQRARAAIQKKPNALRPSPGLSGTGLSLWRAATTFERRHNQQLGRLGSRSIAVWSRFPGRSSTTALSCHHTKSIRIGMLLRDTTEAEEPRRAQLDALYVSHQLAPVVGVRAVQLWKSVPDRMQGLTLGVKSMRPLERSKSASKTRSSSARASSANAMLSAAVDAPAPALAARKVKIRSEPI